MDKMIKYLIFMAVSLFPLYFSHVAATKKTIYVDEEVKSVNNAEDLPWKANNYGEKKIDIEEFVKTKMGLKMEGKTPQKMSAKTMIKKARMDSDKDYLDMPVNFTWANSKNTKCQIGHIRDQSNCGSCWAVAAAAALGDRFCVQSNGNITVTLSQEQITACDKSNYGCGGGYIDKLNNYMIINGTITGGDYESDVGCQQYTIRPCGYPVGYRMPCEYRFARTPKCKANKCNNDWYEKVVEPDNRVYRAADWWFVKANNTHSREDRIREEIYRNGPVTAAFWVPNDFILYREGVYVPGRRSWYTGGHAVRVVGWGIENKIKYWHVANSWSTEWGEGGFFKIIRGVNACMFETWITAFMPKL